VIFSQDMKKWVLQLYQYSELKINIVSIDKSILRYSTQMISQEMSTTTGVIDE
jgi:hypothetical protein